MKKEKYTDGRTKWWHNYLMAITLLLGVSFISTLRGQSDTTLIYEEVLAIPVVTDYFTTDQIGNVYAVTPGDELIKYRANGTVAFTYNNARHGDMQYVDASNPLQILVFYPDFQLIQTLDRTLNLSGQVNLLDLDLFQTKAIATSGDAQVWVFDEVTSTLFKIDNEGKILNQSNDLKLQLAQAPAPVWMTESNWQLYLYDPAQGLLVFDIFGNYRKTIPLPALKNLQIHNDKLLYLTEQGAEQLDLRSFATQTFPLPRVPEAIEQLRVANGLLYVRTSEHIRVFRLPTTE